MHAEWAKAWAKLPCEPGTVEEMRLWITARETILANVADAREQEGVVERSERAVQMHISAMVAASDGSLTQTVAQETLTATLRAARALVAELAVASRDRAEHEREQIRLLEELATASENATEATEARAAWDTGWKRVTDALGLPDDATPAQAKAQLACIDGCSSACTTPPWCCGGGSAPSRRTGRTSSATRAISPAKLAPALSEPDAITIADTLHAEASKARGIRATRAQLEPRARRALESTPGDRGPGPTRARRARNCSPQRAGVTRR